MVEKRLKRLHNKIKRRIALGHDKPGDTQKLHELKLKLNYIDK